MIGIHVDKQLLDLLRREGTIENARGGVRRGGGESHGVVQSLLGLFHDNTVPGIIDSCSSFAILTRAMGLSKRIMCLGCFVLRIPETTKTTSHAQINMEKLNTM